MSEMSEPSRHELSLADTGSTVRPFKTSEPDKKRRQILPSFQFRQPAPKSRTQASSHNNRFAPLEHNVKVSKDRGVPDMKRKEKNVFVSKTGLEPD